MCIEFQEKRVQKSPANSGSECFFHIIIFTNQLGDYMHSFSCLVHVFLGIGVSRCVDYSYLHWCNEYSYASSGLHAPTIRFPNVVVGIEFHQKLNTN